MNEAPEPIYKYKSSVLLLSVKNKVDSKQELNIPAQIQMQSKK
jgi:hypothetical protein